MSRLVSSWNLRSNITCYPNIAIENPGAMQVMPSNDELCRLDKICIHNMYSPWAVKMHAFIALLFQTKFKLTYLSYRTKNVGYKLIFLKMIGSMTLTPEVGM